MSIDTLLWVLAAICFLLSALGVKTWRVNTFHLAFFFIAMTFVV